MAYLLADSLPPKGGREVLAKIRKANPLELCLAGIDLVVLISEDHWNRHGEAWSLALLDHEFCHVEVKEKDGRRRSKFSILGA